MLLPFTKLKNNKKANAWRYVKEKLGVMLVR